MGCACTFHLIGETGTCTSPLSAWFWGMHVLSSKPAGETVTCVSLSMKYRACMYLIGDWCGNGTCTAPMHVLSSESVTGETETRVSPSMKYGRCMYFLVDRWLVGEGPAPSHRWNVGHKMYFPVDWWLTGQGQVPPCYSVRKMWDVDGLKLNVLSCWLMIGQGHIPPSQSVGGTGTCTRCVLSCCW